MKKLNTYIAKQIVVGFLLVSFSLMSIIWLTQSLRFVDLITNKGIAVSLFVKMTSLLMPRIFTILSPISLFAAVLFVYNRMLSDRELVVMKAAGISPWQNAKCSAIISDTLLFRSPTCTPMDRAAAVSLAEMAGIKLDEFANQMFEAGSELKGKSDAEILYLDFKKFSAGKTNFGVGQINSLNAEELGKLKNRMLPFMEKAREDEGLDMIFFMLTNILTETTELLCVGQGAAQVVADAFHVGDANEELKQTATLPGVVSRKKQLIPALTVTLEQ